MTTVQTRSELREFDERWLDKRGNYYCLIAPDKAAELMGRNENNRRIKPLKIAQYAKDMADGVWMADASDIKFSRDGQLLDGQNRLLACIEADVPFPTLVRTGLDPEAQDHMDVGAVRTMGDVFRLHGVPDYNNVSAAVGLRARYEAALEEGQTILEKRQPLTRHQARAYLEEHPMLVEMIKVASGMYGTAPGIQRSVWLAGLSMAAEVDEEVARRFAASFMAGEAKGPVLALMRYAMSTQTPKQQERAVKLKNAGMRHLTAFIKAWVAYSQEQPLDRITIRDDEKVIPAK